MRLHQLTTDLEDGTGGRAVSLSNHLPPGEALAGVDMLVIDGPAPNPIGPVSAVEPEALGRSLQWLEVSLLALCRGVPTAFHGFDIREPLPAWAKPLVAGVLAAANRILVVDDDAERRTRTIAPDARVERIDHPLSRLESTDRSFERDRYWLLDVTPTGMDRGVTMRTVHRLAGEQAVNLLRVRPEPFGADQPEDTREIILSDLTPGKAISLVNEASGVVLADRDLAAAARALGVPAYPGIDLLSGTWAALPEDLVADRLIEHAMSRPVEPLLPGEKARLRKPDWRGIFDAGSESSSLDHLVADLSEQLAAEAHQARTARFGQVIMRSDVKRAERRARQLQQMLAETRAERATLRGQMQRAQAAREVASEAITDYRRKLRRTETRVENLTGTVEQLRAKLEQQAQSANDALARLGEERTRLEEERDRMASRVADAEDRYDRLRERKAVRAALAMAGWWGRRSRRS